MKKSILLLSAGLLVAGISHGQQASRSVLFHNGSAGNAQSSENVALANSQVGRTVFTQGTTVDFSTPAPTKNVGAKTTTGGSRWYDYVNDILPLTSTAISNTGLDIWWDTSSIMGYTGGTTIYSGNTFVGVGLGFNPTYTQWNDITLFAGEYAITPTDNYTIDSVVVAGWYNRNPAKTLVKDTLILQFVVGDGTATSNLGTGSFSAGSTTATHYGLAGALSFLRMYHDSINNRAGGISGTTVTTLTTHTYKIILGSGDTNNSNALMGTQYPRPGGTDPIISVPVLAGQYASMSVTFRSGDNTYPAWPAHDTCRYSDGTTVTGYKYGCYRSDIIFAATSSGGTTAAWPYYDVNDKVSGYFRKNGAGGWGGEYIPNWPWYTTTTGDASSLQYPFIAYHTQCSTCNLISPILGVNSVTDLSKVSVSPNPATDVLNISFKLAQGANAKVTLTNMVGQVVATQNSTSGNVIMNTTALPAGIYVYTVDANGSHATGRVVVAK